MPFPDFDKGVPTGVPLSARQAVDRGHRVVNRPVIGMQLMFLLGAIVAINFTSKILLGPLLMLCAFTLPHLWWSWAAPRWREWALSRGADPDELQGIAQREKLLWPQGHWCERLEIPVRKQLPKE